MPFQATVAPERKAVPDTVSVKDAPEPVTVAGLRLVIAGGALMGSMTVPVALAQFLNSDESPWNYMMATAIVYAVPPVVVYYLFRGRMTAGLTMGGVKG